MVAGREGRPTFGAEVPHPRPVALGLKTGQATKPGNVSLALAAQPVAYMTSQVDTLDLLQGSGSLGCRFLFGVRQLAAGSFGPFRA